MQQFMLLIFDVNKMGKRRSRQQSSNDVTMDSSESDVNQNLDKSQNPIKLCPHAGKSVEPNQVKKNIHLEDIANNNFCLICSKLGEGIKSEDVWVCLRCGSKACSLEHSQTHNDIPHSDSHALSFKLTDKIIWCHSCKLEIQAASNKKLQCCISNVENMYSKYMQSLTTSSLESPKALATTETTVPVMEKISEENVSNDTETCKVIALPPPPPPPPALELRSLPKLRTSLNGPPVKGLANLGNTCYFNSVVQCLAQTPNLIETLKEMDVSNKEVEINLKSGKCLSGTLEKWDSVCESLWNTLSDVKSGGPTHNPQRLLNSLRKKVPQFREMEQHDSHELLRHLLDLVRSQDHKRYRRLILNEFGVVNVDNVEKLDSEKKKEIKQLDKEMTDVICLTPDQIFRGSLVSRLVCQECNHTSDRVESFLDLSLPISCEKPQPPSVLRRKCFNNSEDKNSTTTKSKHQLKKEKKLERKKNRGKYHPLQPQNKKDLGKGEPIIGPMTQNGGDGSDGDGDVESEGSEMKFAEPPVHSENNSRFPENTDSSPSSPTTLRKPEVVSDYTKIALSNGFPDISQLTLSDPMLPKLKTIVRDAATIVKENSTTEPNLEEVHGSEDLSAAGTEKENEDGEKKTEPEPNSDVEKISNEVEVQLSDSEDIMMGSLFDDTNTVIDTHGEFSIQSCLAQFTSIELMAGSNKVGCEQCTARANKGNKDGKTVYTMSTKRYLISEAPPVIILHLKRFEVQLAYIKKLSRHINFPLELDISPFCMDDLKKKNSNKLVYNLYGVVEHSGTVNGGHYVAYMKVADRGWVYASDSNVYDVTESRVLQSQAYILFYFRSS